MAKATKVDELEFLTWDEIEKKGLMDQLKKSIHYIPKMMESSKQIAKNRAEGKPSFIYGDDGKVIARMG